MKATNSKWMRNNGPWTTNTKGFYWHITDPSPVGLVEYRDGSWGVCLSGAGDTAVDMVIGDVRSAMRAYKFRVYQASKFFGGN